MSEAKTELQKLTNELLLKALEALELSKLEIDSNIAHPQSVWFYVHIIKKQQQTLTEIRQLLENSIYDR